MPSPVESPRAREIKNIHIAKRDLCLDDDTYRDVLARITGLRSAADLDAKQRRAVIDEFYRLGWRPKTHRSPGKVPASKAALVAKIKALLADAGRPWAYADEVASRVCKVSSVRFCDENQLRKIVAALMIDQRRRQVRAEKQTPPEAA